jgi:hypothetical protein
MSFIFEAGATFHCRDRQNLLARKDFQWQLLLFWKMGKRGKKVLPTPEGIFPQKCICQGAVST